MVQRKSQELYNEIWQHDRAWIEFGHLNLKTETLPPTRPHFLIVLLYMSLLGDHFHSIHHNGLVGKVLAAKPNDLNSIPRTNMVGGEN